MIHEAILAGDVNIAKKFLGIRQPREHRIAQGCRIALTFNCQTPPFH
jgi:hypothetical protein